eukprot:m.282551 g.282551  ORF g.282551 m.282551 type:complete len:168 (+) comp19854_c0_seq2:1124-1627(+)
MAFLGDILVARCRNYGHLTGGVGATRGCNCVKTHCLKRYCECFQAGMVCSSACACVGCKNTDVSTERRALLRHIKLEEKHPGASAENSPVKGADDGLDTTTQHDKTRRRPVNFISDEVVADACKRILVAGDKHSARDGSAVVDAVETGLNIVKYLVATSNGIAHTHT